MRLVQPRFGSGFDRPLTSEMQIDPACGTMIELPPLGIVTMFGGVLHLKSPPPGGTEVLE